MAAQKLTIEVSAEGVSAEDLKTGLSEQQQSSAQSVEIRVPRPAPGGLASLDQVVQLAIEYGPQIAGGLTAVFGIVKAWIGKSGKPTKVKVGANTLEIPGNVPAATRDRMFDEFMAAVAAKHSAPGTASAAQKKK